ncbi:MAG: calcium-binding protein [Pseudomonadota bacterium]
MSSAGNGFSLGQPKLYFETDGDGNQFLRVEEQRVEVRTADTVIESEELSSNNYAVRLTGEDTNTVSIIDVDITDTRNGVVLVGTGGATVYDVTFDGLELGNSRYGVAFRLGGKGGDGFAPETTDTTYIQRVTADGQIGVLESYRTSPNTDFIANERGNAPVYLRDITAENFSDGIVDNKSVIYIQNATFEEAYRVLRAHEGAEIIIANSELSSENGQALAWLGGPNAKISFYNTTWNGKPRPDADDVRGEGLSVEETLARIVELDHNPLPEIDPFFATSVEKTHIEIQEEDGTWTPLTIDGVEGGFPPIGDPRFDISSVVDGDAQIRVRYEANGEFGPYSDTLLIEDGVFAGYAEPVVIPEPAPEPASEDRLVMSEFTADKDGVEAQSAQLSAEGPVFEPQPENWDKSYSDVRDTLFEAFENEHDRSSDEKADYYVGTAGSNRYRGDQGNDFISGGAGNDRLFGGRDNDVLIGGDGADRLNGDKHDDFLDGGSGNDRLSGGTGDDVLVGGDGNDRLFADDGDDILVGGDGRDFLVGGKGADTYVFSRDDALDGQKDEIRGFSKNEGDKLDLSAVFGGAEINADNIDKFVSLEQKGNRTELKVDLDGDGEEFVVLAEIKDFDRNLSVQDLLDDDQIIV